MRLKRGSSLVIATHNAGKLAELQELLAPYALKLTSCGQLGLPEPEETALTFIGNAEIKAKSACLASKKIALADDSGLEIAALGGFPGVHSARFGKEFASYPEAMTELAKRIEGKSTRAFFVCALSLAFPNGEIYSFEERLEGVITEQKGIYGFGYDAFFRPLLENRTFGEMTATEKHGLPPLGLGLSHRAKAFIRLKEEFMPHV